MKKRVLGGGQETERSKVGRHGDALDRPAGRLASKGKSGLTARHGMQDEKSSSRLWPSARHNREQGCLALTITVGRIRAAVAGGASLHNFFPTLD